MSFDGAGPQNGAPPEGDASKRHGRVHTAGERRLTLVVNPSAGRGRAARKLPAVRRYLASLPGTTVDVVVAGDATDAADQCRRVVDAASGLDALVVMGGDGMASVGLNAAAGTGVPLGVLPAGTGNDFCRGVGLPGTLTEAVRVIAAGGVRSIDLMHVTGDLTGTSPVGRASRTAGASGPTAGAATASAASRWVGSIVSTGFDEKVNWRTNHLPFNIGAPSYVYSIVAELATFKPLRYRLVVDAAPREIEAILVAVGNAGVFGGGIRVLPTASVTDGLLDVTIVHPVPRALLFRLFRKLFTGEFASHPAIETLRAREVIVDGEGLFGMADGEDLGRPPFTCRVVPDALRIFAP